jgi:4-diphosphocytidyl-2-C-methyl-D-erythritol kinase
MIERGAGSVTFEPDSSLIDNTSNLVVDAIAAFNRISGTSIWPDVVVEKRIPIASGLGGASADCAATLFAMNQLSGQCLDETTLLDMAASLGSDVPFFLGSRAARVSGRGTDLQPVRIPSGFVVIVSPNIQIAHKTQTLYSALRAEDFSNGTRIEQQVRHLNQFRTIDRDLLDNAFETALHRISATARSIADEMTECGVKQHWLSGAGPSRYAIFDDRDLADRTAIRLRDRLGDRAKVYSTTFSSTGPRIVR